MTRRGENSIILKSQYHAGMMELADMRDLGSRAAMRWGSSPHARTTSSRTSYRSRRRFFFQNNRHRSFTPSLLLSKLNSLRWASIWGFSFLQASYRSRRRFFVPNKRHRSFTPSLLLSKLNPLTLGFNLGFSFCGADSPGWEPGLSFICCRGELQNSSSPLLFSSPGCRSKRTAPTRALPFTAS